MGKEEISFYSMGLIAVNNYFENIDSISFK